MRRLVLSSQLSWHQYGAFLLFIIRLNIGTILIIWLHMITYDLLLHVSTLIRHLQGTLHSWIKLHRLLILILSISTIYIIQPDMKSSLKMCLTSKHVGTKLYRLLILVKSISTIYVILSRHEDFPEDDVWTSKYVGANNM